VVDIGPRRSQTIPIRCCPAPIRLNSRRGETRGAPYRPERLPPLLSRPLQRGARPRGGPTLAAAATLADLRVGTWGTPLPLRATLSLALEAHSLSVLFYPKVARDGHRYWRPGWKTNCAKLGLPVLTTTR